ncbi:MAG TPA: SDR family NAD(P)-dependent oxidoreductase [Acidobacteriota bacterium]|nr:SDR family NAD(P)-dependent oxidoreductase [Acidobacteriota bacterium]
MILKDEVAIVTGGNAGIGKATARRLGMEGAKVAICGRNESTLESAVRELKGEGIEAFHRRCDAADARQVGDFVSSVAERFDRIDVLVNNAGISGLTPLRDPDDGVWSSIIETNLSGPYYFLSRVLPHMPEGGRVINVSSVLGRFGVPGYAAYCTSKHGIIGLTRVAALELADRRITVNAVCPGWVETDLARQGMERGAAGMNVTYEEFREKALRRVPLKEIIEPEEVAALILFLASPEARNITGQTYNLCGGQVMN